jgi:hypothetical protein
VKYIRKIHFTPARQFLDYWDHRGIPTQVHQLQPLFVTAASLEILLLG